MIRTQIYLPEDLHHFAKKYAQDHKTSMAEMIRQSLIDKFMKSTDKNNEAHEWLTNSIGLLGHSGQDIDHNEIYDAPLPWEK